jgi:hypothetical protein
MATIGWGLSIVKGKIGIQPLTGRGVDDGLTVYGIPRQPVRDNAPEVLPPGVPAFAIYREVSRAEARARYAIGDCIVSSPPGYELPARASRHSVMWGGVGCHVVCYLVTSIWSRKLCGEDGLSFAPTRDTPPEWVLAAVRKTITSTGRRLSRYPPVPSRKQRALFEARQRQRDAQSCFHV